MNKISVIILREFTTRILKKSFIILTILMPFLMAGIVAVPFLLGQLEDDKESTIAVIDQTGLYRDCLKSNERYHYVFLDHMTPELRSDTSDITAVLQISDDLTRNPKAASLGSTSEIQLNLTEYVENQLAEKVRHDRLAEYNIPELEHILNEIDQQFTLTTMKWDNEGNESETFGDVALIAGFLFTFLIYMFVMSYGGMVMQSVMEEKTNRIVELMVSSVKPFQLMMGKIIGISLVGFLQLAIWGVMLAGILFGASVLFGADLSSAGQSGMALQGGMGAEAAAMAVQGEENEILTAILGLPFGEMGLLFVLYFVGGYLLYASFFAAVGASVNEQEDSSQFMMPVVLIMVFGLYAAMGSVQNTNGPLAFWASMFPLTSPIVMMVRVPFSVPLWEELLSLVLLYATALGSVWFSARIYRVGVLMYGKKPTLKEWFKWIRYR